MMTRFFMVSVIVLLALGWSPNATAVIIVSPSADTSVEGNSNNGFPFNIGFFGLSSERYDKYIKRVISDLRHCL